MLGPGLVPGSPWAHPARGWGWGGWAEGNRKAKMGFLHVFWHELKHLTCVSVSVEFVCSSLCVTVSNRSRPVGSTHGAFSSAPVQTWLGEILSLSHPFPLPCPPHCPRKRKQPQKSLTLLFGCWVWFCFLPLAFCSGPCPSALEGGLERRGWGLSCPPPSASSLHLTAVSRIFWGGCFFPSSFSAVVSFVLDLFPHPSDWRASSPAK